MDTFTSKLPEYFELSDDIELGLLLASQSLEAKTAFDVWREIQRYPEQP
jgi:uncharacterized surface anchored protein